MQWLSSVHKIYIRGIASLLWLNERLLFYPALRKFYRNTFPKDQSLVILDVGANRGQSIVFFKKLFPKAIIHSFEPNPKLFAGLVKKFSRPDIHLHPLGISNITGERVFYEHVFDETSGFEKAVSGSRFSQIKNAILMTNERGAIGAGYPVQVTTLDAFAPSAQFERIDILKIDVEGHEASVLEGAADLLGRAIVCYIQMERHYDDQYALSHTQIDEALLKAGYVECFRKKHGFGNFYEVVYRGKG